MRQEGKCGKLLGSLAAEGLGGKGTGDRGGAPQLGLLRRVPVSWASASSPPRVAPSCSPVLRREGVRKPFTLPEPQFSKQGRQYQLP